MTDQQFDAFFKNKLSAHASPVKEEVWQKVIATKERKRRLLLWLPLSAALLLIIFGAGYFLITATNEKQPVTATKPLPALIKNNNKQEKQTQAILKQAGKNDNAKQQALSAGKIIVADKKLNEKFYAQHEASKQNNIAADINNKPAETLLNSAKASGQSVSTQAAIATPRDQEKDNTVFNKEVISASTDSLNKAADAVTAVDSAKSVVANNIIKPFKNKIKKWFIEVYGAPEYAFQQLNVNEEKSASSAFNNSGYIVTLKKQSESLVTSFTTGVRVARRLNTHLLIKTGIEYRQINARFHYYLNGSQSLPQSYLNNFDLYSLTGANYNLSSSNQYKQTYTLYKSFSIPVLFSYEKAVKKFSVAAAAGPVFTVNRSYSGYTINSSNLQRESTGNDAVYKKNTGISLYAGLSFIKPISKKLELFVEPHLQYNLSNMVKKDAAFKQKIHNAGVAVGIRFPIK